jgi:hypothetical protein
MTYNHSIYYTTSYFEWFIVGMSEKGLKNPLAYKMNDFVSDGLLRLYQISSSQLMITGESFSSSL